MRIVFIFIINYNLKGEFKMGKIETYYKQGLTEVTNRGLESISEKFNEENSNGIKNSQLHDLAKLFLDKVKQASDFSSTIQHADANIEKLTKIDKQNNQKAMGDSLQQALFDEITYFQTTAKKNCSETLGALNAKVEGYKSRIDDIKEKIKSEKSKKKSASDRIKGFFGLSKDENEKENLQTIKDCNNAIKSIERKIKDSKETLNQAKATSKLLKNTQQSNFGLMTKKSVKHAIHNEDKGTGMIGCLIQVADFLNQYYVTGDDCDIILDKTKSSLKSKLKGIFSKTSSKEQNNKNKQIKINSSELERMKELLEDDHPKHFMECQRKITKFSQVDIDSLKNSNNNTHFDVDEFNKLKGILKTKMGTMFSDLNETIKEYAATVNDKKYDNNPKLRKKLQKAHAEDIYSKQNEIIKEYKNMRKEFTKKIKGLLPKSIKNKDDLASSLASLAIFNCSTQLSKEDKVIQDFVAQKDANEMELLKDRIFFACLALYCSIGVVAIITLLVTVPLSGLLNLLRLVTLAVIGFDAGVAAIYGDKFIDLDIISGDITERRLSAQ